MSVNPRQSWIPGCGFWFRGTARFGFLVSGTWIPDSLIWITDSKAEGPEFTSKIFPGFRNLDDLTGSDFVSAVSLL